MPLELHLDRGKTPQSVRDGAVITIPSAFLDFFFFRTMCVCHFEGRKRQREQGAEENSAG